MNETYNLSWNLKRQGTMVLFNKTYTIKGQKRETVDIGVKPEDMDNIKIEAEIIENLYTVKLGVSSFDYWYEPIVITGEPVGNVYGNEFSGDLKAKGSTSTHVSKNINEAHMPYSDESYFSNMSVTSARQLGKVADAGVLMRNAGKMTITIPNPLSGERKTEINPYFQLEADLKTKYYPVDLYDYTIENVHQQAHFSVDWKADGKLEIYVDDSYGDWDVDRSNTVYKIKITGHGRFDT